MATTDHWRLVLYDDDGSPYGPPARRTVRWIFIPVLLAAILLAVLLISLLVSSRRALELTAEAGFVEKLTVLAYIVAAGVVLSAGAWRGQMAESLVLSTPLSLLALREMDFHVRFTTMGVFKTRYYLSPEVPYLERVVVIAILAMLIWAASPPAGRRGRGS